MTSYLDPVSSLVNIITASFSCLPEEEPKHNQQTETLSPELRPLFTSPSPTDMLPLFLPIYAKSYAKYFGWISANRMLARNKRR